MGDLVDSIKAQGHIVKDSKGIFSAVDKMGKPVSGIVESSQALKSPPNSWECGEETEEPGMRRVAVHRIVPAPGVKTEQELDILRQCQWRPSEDLKGSLPPLHRFANNTYLQERNPEIRPGISRPRADATVRISRIHHTS